MHTLRSLAGTALMAASLATSAGAADYFVPSDDDPTLFSAIAHARVSPDADNTIFIKASPLMISATATLDNAFGIDRKLTIRPGGALTRATIASVVSDLQAFYFNGCGYVTLQDLDIVRDITNAQDLIVAENDANNVLIQRCRLGSIWTVPGAPGKSILRADYPRELVVRNCIFFAAAPGTFDYGLWATAFNDDRRSLFLYNNVVADHRLAGVRISDGVGAHGSLVLLRNNVASNHPGLAPEPYGFVSEVDGFTEVVTSHNVAFATAGFDEMRVGAAVTIAGVGGGTLLGFGRAAADPAFFEQTWDLDPAWDPNPNFWRLVDGGPLHFGAEDFGQTVSAGAPHARDYAVADDIERQGRPGGVPNPHTDRGADQIESGVALAVGPVPGAGVALWAAPVRSPTRAVRIAYRAASAGRLQLELLDAAGRLLHRAERRVVLGEGGVLETGVANRPGVIFYRVRLLGDDGVRHETRGRAALLR